MMMLKIHAWREYEAPIFMDVTNKDNTGRVIYRADDCNHEITAT